MTFDVLSTLITSGFTVISILAFLAAKYGGVDSNWSKAMMDTILPMIVQAWILNFTVIVQHRYGSSQGSANKDQLIKEVIEKLAKKPNEETLLNNEIK